MNTNTKELIAVGASIAAHCQPCLKYHYAKARELGLSREEIAEALAIGHQVEAGARKAIRDFEAVLVSGESTAPEDSCGESPKEGNSCC